MFCPFNRAGHELRKEAERMWRTGRKLRFPFHVSKIEINRVAQRLEREEGNPHGKYVRKNQRASALMARAAASTNETARRPRSGFPRRNGPYLKKSSSAKLFTKLISSQILRLLRSAAQSHQQDDHRQTRERRPGAFQAPNTPPRRSPLPPPQTREKQFFNTQSSNRRRNKRARHRLFAPRAGNDP